MGLFLVGLRMVIWLRTMIIVEGPMLLLLHDMGANMVVVFIEQLVAFVAPRPNGLG